MKRKPLDPGKYLGLFLYFISFGCMLTGCGRGDDFFQEADLEISSGKELQDLSQEMPQTSVTEAAVTEIPLDTGTSVVTEVTKEPEVIYVDVSGAVVSPGVYRLEAGSRVFQAIEAAGGCTSEASAVWLNQAAGLSDGQKVYVPTAQEAEAAGESTADGAGFWGEAGIQPSVTDQDPGTAGEISSGDGKVNINTADKEQLTTLPGVGSSKAEAILAYRQEQGGFSSIDEIMNVEGIKEGVFAKIKDKISVD